jgi:hypothetical protein
MCNVMSSRGEANKEGRHYGTRLAACARWEEEEWRKEKKELNKNNAAYRSRLI